MTNHSHNIRPTDVPSHTHVSTSGVGSGVGIRSEYAGYGLWVRYCTCCGEKLGDSDDGPALSNPHIRVQFSCKRKESQ